MAADALNKAPPDFAGWIEALERILRAQLEGQQRLLECIQRKRQAIRIADIAAVTAICGEEHANIQRLTQLEKSRLQLLGRITQAIQPNACTPLTLSEIAACAMVPEPQQSRLLALAAQLRDTMADVKRHSSIVRCSAEALSRHMSGIVQTVHSALSRARIYSQRGNIALGAQVQSVVDLRS